MKVYNFFLLLTCVALNPSLISSNFLFYGSNQVEGSTALNFYGNEVCPRESQSFAVGSPAMSIDELLGISSGPFEQLEGRLLWENGQAIIEETAQLMAEKVQEGVVAPVVEKAEEAVECVEAFVIESYEDLLQFYELFPWFNEEAEEECVEEGEQEEVGKTTEADLAEEGKELEAAVAVVEQQIAPVAEEEEVSESLREAEKKKVLRMLSSIISVGFLGSLALAFLSIASVVYAMLKEDAESKQQFPEMLTPRPSPPNNNKNRRRKTAALAKALTAPQKSLALPAPPKKEVQQTVAADVLPWPLDGECSSETNVSMEDVSQSCA